MTLRHSPSRFFPAFAATLAALFFLLCGSDLALRPVDPAYQGDYRLAPDTSGLSGELSVFTAYRVGFLAGRDTFWRFESNDVDIGLLHASYRSGDSLTLYCIRASDSVRIVCVRPNGQTERVVVPRPAVAPWTISGPLIAAQGTTVRYRVTGAEPDPQWRVAWSATDTLGVNSDYTFEVTAPRTVGATLLDNYGHGAALTPLLLSVAAGGIPVIGHLDVADTLDQGDTLTARILTSGGSGVFRAVLTAGGSVCNDTTLFFRSGSAVSLAGLRGLIDTGLVRITVTAVDSESGLRSEERVATVRVRYVLPVVTFADSVLIVPAGIATRISAGGTAWRYHWLGNRLDIDTVTDSAWLEVTFNSQNAETLSVSGVNVWGSRGTPAHCILIPRTYRYTAQISGPVTAAARRWVFFGASLLESGSTVSNAAFTWSVTPLPDSIQTQGDSLGFFFSDSTNAVVRVLGIAQGDTSNTTSQIVSIRRQAPWLAFSHDRYAASINVAVTLAVTAADSSPDGTVSQIRYRVTSPVADTLRTLAGTTREWQMVFSQPDTYTVEAWAVDDDGFASPPARTQVIVTAGAPYFTLGNQSIALYAHDTTTLRVVAQGGSAGVQVVRYIWMRGAGVLSDGPADSLVISYTQAVQDTIMVRAVNSLGDTSIIAAKIVLSVDAGMPVVHSITPDPVQTWVHTDLRVRILGWDVNGMIRLVEIDHDGNGTVDRSIPLSRDTIDTTITVRYTTPGSRTVQVRLTDEDGVSSLWQRSDTIMVDAGMPQVNGLTPDTAVWAFDPVRISVTARDNGSIVACSLSADGVLWHGYGSLTIDTIFTASGTMPVYVKVTDNDGLTSPVYIDTIMVRLGAPVVYAVRGDTARDSVFVRDLRRDTVWYHDTNGTVQAVYVNRSGGDTADDSIVVDSKSGFVVFSHAWDTSRAGNRYPRYWAMDDDLQRSMLLIDTVSVRLGAPLVWGDTPGAAQDTVWLVVDRGFRDYYYKPYYADTNGVIEWFWFGASSDTAAASYKGPADSALIEIDASRINKGVDRYIHVRDDDDLVRNGRFVVFADSAPPAPTFFDRGIDNDSVVLKWEKKLDYKDGMQTRIQIVTCFGSGCTPSDSLYNADAWPTLAEIEAKWPTEDIGGIICNVIKFKAPQSGAGRWRVVLRDGRGTRTVAPDGAFPATFVAP